MDIASPGAPCADPVLAAIDSLIKLDGEGHTNDPALTETLMKQQIAALESNDFSRMEEILVCQTHMLHKLFAQSVTQYAEARSDDRKRLMGGLALKAQTYCRQTITTLRRIKSQAVPELPVLQNEGTN